MKQPLYPRLFFQPLELLLYLIWNHLNESLTHQEKLSWCKGFGIGDGTVEYAGKDKDGKNIKSNRTRIRLCGEKDLQYLSNIYFPE